MTTSPEGTGRKPDGVAELARRVADQTPTAGGVVTVLMMKWAIALAVRAVLKHNGDLAAAMKDLEGK